MDKNKMSKSSRQWRELFRTYLSRGCTSTHYEDRFNEYSRHNFKTHETTDYSFGNSIHTDDGKGL